MKYFKIIIISSFSLLILCGFSSSNNKAGIKLPSFLEWEQINDSIFNEAMTLYYYEKMAWLSTDSAKFHNVNHDDIRDCTLVCYDDRFNYIFVSDRDSILFETNLYFNEDNQHFIVSDKKRPITELEKRAIDEKETMVNTAIEEYGDSILVDDINTINFEACYLPNNVRRLFIICGTTQDKVLPLGDDYSFDFDDNLKIVKWRKYHNSRLLVPLEEDAEKITISLSPNTPYVPVTDICTFLLYGYELYGIEEMDFYHTAFDQKVYSKFFPAQHKIITVLDDKVIW